MRITEITVSYEATESLPDYSNVRPGLRLTAVLDETDDYIATRLSLLAEARFVVEAEIDRTLIACGKAPRYYAGPRFQALHNSVLSLIVIIPNETNYRLLEDATRNSRWVHIGVLKMSLAQARQVAREHSEKLGATLMDCSNSDLSALAQFAGTVHVSPMDGHQPDSEQLPF